MKKILLGLIGLLFAVPSWATNLPAGYTELEYIRFDGSQYIITNYIMDQTSNPKVELKIKNKQGSAFGSQVGETRSILDFSSHLYCGAGTKRLAYVLPNDDNIHILSGEYNTNTTVLSVYVDGVLQKSDEQPGSFSTNEFAFGAINGGSGTNKLSGDVYSFKVYQNNVLVLNLIPAQRNSDNVIGLYDTVSGNFYTNAGTGEFTAGPVVSIRIATTAYNSARFSPVMTELNSTIATIRSVVTNTINQTKAIADLQATKQTRPNENCPAGKKCLLVEDDAGQPHWYEIIENAYGLPSGYTGLEYIESRVSPTEAYIDTGLNYKSNYIYEITYAKGGLQNVFMGARATTDYQTVGNFSLSYSSSSCMYSSTSTNSTAVNFGDATFGVKHTVKYQQSTSTLLFDNTNKWDSNWVTNTEIPFNVYLFAFNRGGTPGGSRTEYARIYTYSVKDSNDTFVQNFVPAKNASGVVGMYDTVSGRFFTNAGTGTFTAGPEI